MFSRVSRLSLPLRRCIHSSARQTNPSHPYRLTLGVSALVTATYLTWRLTYNNNSIALDSKSELPLHKSAASSKLGVTSQTSTFIEPEEQKNTSRPTELPDQSAKQPPTDVEVESQPNEDAAGGAFNPVTGEINWDCPCLGGMAYGPCGQEFREAFSCFVYSEEEPKGINCVEKFKGMQDCFRAHPETYGDEIMDDEDGESVPSPATPISEEAHPEHELGHRQDPVSVPKSADPGTQQQPHSLGSSGDS